MRVTVVDGITRWTPTHKAALIVEIIRGTMAATEASRAYDLSPTEIEGLVDDTKQGMENVRPAVRKKYDDIQ